MFILLLSTLTQFSAPLQDLNQKFPFLYPEHELTRTQDLEIYYHDTGMFYWGTYTAWASEFPMHTSGLTMTVPHWRCRHR